MSEGEAQGSETGLRSAARFHEAGKSNEAGVGDGSNQLSGPGCRAGRGPFRSLAIFIARQHDLWVTPKLSKGNPGP